MASTNDKLGRDIFNLGGLVGVGIGTGVARALTRHGVIEDRLGPQLLSTSVLGGFGGLLFAVVARRR